MEKNNNTTQVSFFPLILQEMEENKKNSYNSLYEIVYPAIYNENCIFKMILSTALIQDTFFFDFDTEGDFVVKTTPKDEFYVCEREDRLCIKGHYIINISIHIDGKDELLGVFLFSKNDISVRQVLFVKYFCWYKKDGISNTRYIHFMKELRSLQSVEQMVRNFVTPLEAVGISDFYEENMASQMRKETTPKLDFEYTKRNLVFDFLSKNFIQN